MRSPLHLFLPLCTILLVGCPLATPPLESPKTSFDSGEETLGSIVQRTLDANQSGRELSSGIQGAWQILHGVLAYGDQFEIVTASGTQNALQYILDGGAIAGFEPSPGDQLGQPPRSGLRMEMQPGTKVGQGHRDQWLAVMSQCGLSEATELHLPDQTFTMGDWLSQAEYDVPRNLELEFSWTLIALTQYRGTEHSWEARDGNQYAVDDLIYSEVQQSLPDSVCGGTHRLIGLAMALNKRREEGKPITGVWQDAQDTVQEAIAMAKANQNPDGSYSIAYLHRPGWTRDLGETLGTTGHVLEFLAFAADDSTLREPWVERSVRRLCAVLDECQDIDLECGGLYHALHGLREYQRRISD